MLHKKSFFAALGALAALWSSPSSAAAAAGGPVLRIPFPKTTLTLDPGRMEDWYSMSALFQLHRGLFRYQPGGDVEPDMVKSWKEGTGGLSYQLTLGDHWFSDGTPVKASHVVHSLARLFYIASSMSADLSYIKGSAAFVKSKQLADLGLRALDDRTLEIVLERKSGLLFKHLAAADCATLKLASFKDEPELGAKKPASGPYQVVEQTSDRLVLEKWRKDPRDSANPPARIEFLTTDVPPARSASTGEADTLDFVALAKPEREELLKLGWKERVSAALWEHFLILNPARLDPETRRQVQASIDQEALVRTLNDGTYVPAYGLIPAGLPGALSKHDWKEVLGAPAALAKDKKTILIEHNPKQKSLAEAVAPILAKAGFIVKTAEVPSIQNYIERLNKRDYAVMVASRGLDYPDGYSVLAYFRKGYEGNFYHVEDAAIDRSLDEVAQVTSADERVKGYRSLSLAILRHGTIAPLVVGNSFSGFWGPRVTAVPAHPMGFHHLPLESVEMRP